jgi:hypothetical protein
MEVRVGISRKIVVNGQVDTLNINTTTENISRNTDTLVEFLKLLVSLDTIYLSVCEDEPLIVIHTAPPG